MTPTIHESECTVLSGPSGGGKRQYCAFDGLTRRSLHWALKELLFHSAGKRDIFYHWENRYGQRISDHKAGPFFRLAERSLFMRKLQLRNTDQIARTEGNRNISSCSIADHITLDTLFKAEKLFAAISYGLAPIAFRYARV